MAFLLYGGGNEFNRIIRTILDEKKAEQYLLEVGILKTFTATVRNVDQTKLGRIRRGKIKCYDCKSGMELEEKEHA